MLRFNDAERKLDLSVHDVVSIGPPSGHLSMSLGWSGRSRMAAGVAAHRAYQAVRQGQDEEFEAEVHVQHSLLVEGWEVVIKGRMDGLSREGDYWVVEEVKSSVLGYDRLCAFTAADMPEAALQLRMYLHALEARGQRAMGRLIVISVRDGTQHLIQVAPDPEFTALLMAQLAWVIRKREAYLAWMERRRSAAVAFAHAEWRPNQETLANEVLETVERGGHLLLNAPTGLGKTAAVLFGVFTAAYRTDRRVMFVTARTTQQAIVEDTVRRMAAEGVPIRAVSIRARDKACLNEVVACRPDCCAYAHGHHDRVRGNQIHEQLWRESGGVLRVPSPDDLKQVGMEHTVCPFSLAMELTREADIIIGDYNYAFDPSRKIGSLAESPGDWIVVVDEAHNLPDRARGYASPSLLRETVEWVADELADRPEFMGPAELAADILDWMDAYIESVGEAGVVAHSLEDGVNARDIQRFAMRFDEMSMDYALLKAEQPPFEEGDPFIDMGRAVSRMRAALDGAGEETVVIWRSKHGRDPAGIRLLCRDPEPVLAPTFADLSATVIMSATLRPPDFYGSMFGLESNRLVEAEFDSPFPPEHRKVLVVGNVSTEYKKRARDKAAIAAHVESAIRGVPGNVAVFFSSFALRDAVAAEMGLTGRPMIFQERNMDDGDRARVLQTLQKGQNHVLMGVLGGIFSEGIDLPGAGLLAAVIVGPALPAVGMERKLMSAWFQELHGSGFRYAYQVPGMARVVQAAGRVIRTPNDIGAIVLVGRRFLQNEYQAFFPPEWTAVRSNNPEEDLVGLWDV